MPIGPSCLILSSKVTCAGDACTHDITTLLNLLQSLQSTLYSLDSSSLVLKIPENVNVVPCALRVVKLGRDHSVLPRRCFEPAVPGLADRIVCY